MNKEIKAIKKQNVRELSNLVQGHCQHNILDK